MNRTTGRTITAGTGIASLALLVAMAQADSLNKMQFQNLGLGIDDATAIALTSVAGDIIEAELEIERNRPVWEIDIVDESNGVISLEIDGESGDILSSERSDDTAPAMADQIKIDRAIELVRAMENGDITAMEIDETNGDMVWEVEAVLADGTASTFRVDAQTGELL